jgi:hypothetical protein
LGESAFLAQDSSVETLKGVRSLEARRTSGGGVSGDCAGGEMDVGESPAGEVASALLEDVLATARKESQLPGRLGRWIEDWHN